MLRSSELKDLGSETAAQVRQVEATEFGAPYVCTVCIYIHTCAYCYYIIIVITLMMMIIIMSIEQLLQQDPMA